MAVSLICLLDIILRLDQIREDENCDFRNIYERKDANSEDGSESPFTQYHVYCEYHESEQFNNESLSKFHFILSFKHV